MTISAFIKDTLWLEIIDGIRVFPRRLTNGGFFSNRLLFSLLFSGTFCRGNKAVMEG